MQTRLLFLIWIFYAPFGAFAQRANLIQAGAEGLSQLQARAAAGDPLAELRLAGAYESGNGVPQDEQTAFHWYRKAAEQGNREAQNKVGEMYRLGYGVLQDKSEAVHWWLKSARQGNPDAMCNLGGAYYNGDGVDVDESLSYAWFLLAEEAGCDRAEDAVQRAQSQFKGWPGSPFERIAEMYDKGEDLPPNPTEAGLWWLKAAEAGDSDAQLVIALRSFNGQGVPQDAERGRYWCNELVKKRQTSGSYCMGYMYQRGFGVPADPKKARGWYERAATSRYRLAMIALAPMEASGEGGKIDLAGACVLYVRLAEMSDKDALPKLANLRSQVGQNEWKRVEKQLRALNIDVAKVNAALQQFNVQRTTPK
jgi:uncharacterized protein